MNTYGYVDANPIKWTDTYGLKIGYIDPVFTEDIKKIRSTKKGEELWQNMVKNPRTINVYKGSNHCAYGTNLNDPKKIDVYVYTGNHDHLKLSGFKDGKYIQYTPSVTRSLAHELGHTTGTLDDGGSLIGDFFTGERTYNMNNINKWENPIMEPLDGITRSSYAPASGNRCGCTHAIVP